MKPRVFIGSSTESLNVAHAIQENLSSDFEIVVWDQGIFDLSSYTLESIVGAIEDSDFGVYVLSAEDIARIRSTEHTIARDNVVFELGVCIGSLGRHRSFIVVPSESPRFRLPTDLLGITLAKYEPRRIDSNPTAAVGSASNKIRTAINKELKLSPSYESAAVRRTLPKRTRHSILLGYGQGPRDHYAFANEMLDHECRKIVLIQRSSTLLLGPEQGNILEERSYNLLKEKIRDGVEFYHVMSIKGIEEQLSSEKRVYSQIKEALSEIKLVKGTLQLQGELEAWPIKVAGGAVSFTKLFPSFFVEYMNGETEALFLTRIGISRQCFHMAGPEMSNFLNFSRDYYSQCNILLWNDLKGILNGKVGGLEALFK